jgi:hypothetical protein
MFILCVDFENLSATKKKTILNINYWDISLMIDGLGLLIFLYPILDLVKSGAQY